jgi:hypothetical protein
MFRAVEAERLVGSGRDQSRELIMPKLFSMIDIGLWSLWQPQVDVDHDGVEREWALSH